MCFDGTYLVAPDDKLSADRTAKVTKLQQF